MCLVLVFLTACSGGSSKKDLNYNPGTYTGVAQGKAGDIQVQVSFEENRIQNIKVLDEKETPEYAGKALKEMPKRITSKQSLDVDVVSGATLTSRGILDAVASCARDAGVNPADLGYASSTTRSDEASFRIKLKGKTLKTYSGKDLRQYEATTVDSIGINSKGTETPTHGTGVLLETLLAENNVSQGQFKAINFVATDGYEIQVPAEVLENRNIYICYEVNGEATDIRTIVPDERALYWVKFLSDIELLDEVDTPKVNKLVFLENGAKALKKTEQSISIKEFLETYIPEKTDYVTLVSKDTWSRREKYDLFANQQLKITGKESPLYTGASLPEGLEMKDLLYITIGDTSILSGKSWVAQQGEKESVSLMPALKTVGMDTYDTYVLTTLEGKTHTIKKEDLEKATLTVEKDSVKVRVKNKTIGNLLSIEGLE